MKIVAFGDSITYGDTGDHREPHPRRWTTLLAEKTGHEVLNRGVNGDTTRLALERFPRDVQESGADVVLLQFGYNDCNHWDTDRGLPRVSLPAFLANIDEMFKRAYQFDIKPVFVPMHPVRRDPYQEWQEPYRYAIGSTYGRWLPDLEIPDGLHLSTADNEKYADMVFDLLAFAVVFAKAISR